MYRLVVIEGDGAFPCLDEETALDFARGRLPKDRVEAIDEHVDRCDRCRLVLAEATRSFRGQSTGASVSVPPSWTRFAPGDKLAGRYRILRFIARGGMGEVYEAHDLILNTRLAVKTLAVTISDDPHAIRRLKQEVNLARLITHPNVCRIFDLGVHEPSNPPGGPGVMFITMELISGGSLGERLRTKGRLDPAAALPIVQGMVAALGAAHKANVVHRDFKSDNVMLAPDKDGVERAVVMDFGLARAALASEYNSIDRPTFAGTLAYMAPEQLEQQEIGPATDIYALGVVMFEMLTGGLPFKGDPPLVAAWKRVKEPAPSLAPLVPELDPAWHRLVAACLERDPANRPASAEAVERELQHLHPAPTATVRGAAPVPAARQRRLATAIAVTVALGGVGILVIARRPHSGAVASTPMAVAPAPQGAPATPPPPLEAPRPPPAATAPADSQPFAPDPRDSPSAPSRARPATGRRGVARRTAAAGDAAARTPAQAVPASERPATPPPARASDRRRSTDPDDGFIIP